MLSAAWLSASLLSLVRVQLFQLQSDRFGKRCSQTPLRNPKRKEANHDGQQEGNPDARLTIGLAHKCATNWKYPKLKMHSWPTIKTSLAWTYFEHLSSLIVGQNQDKAHLIIKCWRYHRYEPHGNEMKCEDPGNTVHSIACGLWRSICPPLLPSITLYATYPPPRERHQFKVQGMISPERRALLHHHTVKNQQVGSR